jgi:predicted transcriptional regulator
MMIVINSLTSLELCRNYVDEHEIRDELLLGEGTVGRLYYAHEEGIVIRANYLKFRTFKNLFNNAIIIPVYLEKGYDDLPDRYLYDKFLMEICGMTVDTYRNYVKKLRKNNQILEKPEEKVLISKEDRKKEILQMLKDKPQMDSNELAEKFGISRQRVSSIIQEMGIDFGLENRKKIETKMIEEIIEKTKDVEEILRISREKDLNERLVLHLIKTHNLSKRIYGTKIPNVKEIIQDLIQQNNKITINKMAEHLELSPMTIARQLRVLNLTKVDEIWVERNDYSPLRLPLNPIETQAKIKGIIDENPGLTMNEIGKIAGFSIRTVSKHMNRMGFVRVNQMWT